MPRAREIVIRPGGFRVARFGPIELRIDPSWFIWLLLITVTSEAWVSGRARPAAARWSLHLAVALAVSACVVLHELAHSVVAIAYGLPVRRITLFVFGGVSQIEREAPRAGVEFQVAVAGPLTSLVLATVLVGAARALSAHPDGIPHTELGFVGWVNFVLAIFNLLPAFPMDGGRVLRSALWAAQGSRARATRLAGIAGRGLASAIVAAGVLLVIVSIADPRDRQPLGGLWVAMIGLFLYNAASAAAQREGAERPNGPPQVL